MYKLEGAQPLLQFCNGRSKLSFSFLLELSRMQMAELLVGKTKLSVKSMLSPLFLGLLCPMCQLLLRAFWKMEQSLPLPPLGQADTLWYAKSRLQPQFLCSHHAQQAPLSIAMLITSHLETVCCQWSRNTLMVCASPCFFFFCPFKACSWKMFIFYFAIDAWESRWSSLARTLMKTFVQLQLILAAFLHVCSSIWYCCISTAHTFFLQYSTLFSCNFMAYTYFSYCYDQGSEDVRCSFIVQEWGNVGLGLTSRTF